MEAVAILFLLLAWFGLCGGITGLVAKARGHGFWLYFIIGALVSPILGIILALVISPPAMSRRRRANRRAGGGHGRPRTQRLEQAGEARRPGRTTSRVQRGRARGRRAPARRA